MNDRNFIRFREIPLIYGRVPKVANSSIKAALYRLLRMAPDKSMRTTSDAFWSKGTNGETSLESNVAARRCRGTHYTFSFVRNPFDRLVSAYNNKLLELDEVPGPMQAMGLTKGMPFAEFLECIASTSDNNLDVHLLPQASILCLDNQVIPNFVGHLESMDEDWKKLQRSLRQEGLPELGNLPQKNVRRASDHSDISQYFNDPDLIKLVRSRYEADFNIFYADWSQDSLVQRQR